MISRRTTRTSYCSGNVCLYVRFNASMSALMPLCPRFVRQFEDFSSDHADELLQRYRHNICCFNDDIQARAENGPRADAARTQRRHRAGSAEDAVPRASHRHHR